MIDRISPLAAPHDASLGDAGPGYAGLGGAGLGGAGLRDARDQGADSAAAPQPAKIAGSTEAAAKIRPATRLLIDRDKDTGNFIYRVVDAKTGRLLQEIPRQQVEDLKTAIDYVAGALIVTDA